MCAMLSVVTSALLTLLVESAAGQAVKLRCRHERCKDLGSNVYEVDGKRVTVTYSTGYISISCNGESLLESPAMPQAECVLHVSVLSIWECPLPSNSSLADTFAAMNVTLQSTELEGPGELCNASSRRLNIMLLPTQSLLDDSHLTGMEHIYHLRIFGHIQKPTSPGHGFLAPLQNLRSLELSNVVLHSGTLDLLPISLCELTLYYVNGIEWLPEVPALKSLKLTVKTNLQFVFLAQCRNLQKVHLIIEKEIVLPDNWLANCSLLKVLEIEMSFIKIQLPANLLQGASNLTHLALSNGLLETLPAGLLNNAPGLRVLRLNNNKLRTLFRETFSVARRVQILDLSRNDLDSDVMDALAPLRELAELNLAYNSRLGDVCHSDGYSAIQTSTNMRELRLMLTKVSRICSDWKQNMTLLSTLNLKWTNLSNLLIQDLYFTRSVKADVLLPAGSLSTASMSREDYNYVARRPPGGASVYLNEEFNCDCGTYWIRRALDLPQFQHIIKDELRCTDRRRLWDLQHEEMMCARPDMCLASGFPLACTCAVRPDDDSSRARSLVRVRCERAALTRVPRPRAYNHTTEQRYELLLAGNNISEIHAHQLPDYVKALDLRNNSLERVDEETATRLGSIDGMLRLAGNPLDCSCRNAPLLRVLRDRNATRIDLNNATCSDGSQLYAAFSMSCVLGTSPIAWVSALAAGLALALVVSILFSSRERRFFARAVLHRWGFEWRVTEPEDNDRHYDAFVTFSHKDEEVVHELMARLEPTYRLCIHARDWVPGGYIVEQISESVRESQRTLALVSRHFLASSWTRAEFREAHTAAMLEARPRLIVIMLEEPAVLELDEQLRRYVATQTYLRWGGHWFWDKLAVALPKPRAPPPACSPEIESISATPRAAE